MYKRQVRTRDPAVDKYSTPLLYLKGFHALQAYRIGHWLWNQGRRALAMLVNEGLLVSRRGGGTFVRWQHEAWSEQNRCV